MGNLSCTSHGASMAIPSPTFDPGAVLECVAVEKCAALYGVPTMFIAEQNHPAFASTDLSSLRTSLMAGSPCPIGVMKRCVSEMHMSEVVMAYGMTETSPPSAARPESMMTRRAVQPPSVGSTRTSRSTSSIRRPA